MKFKDGERVEYIVPPNGVKGVFRGYVKPSIARLELIEHNATLLVRTDLLRHTVEQMISDQMEDILK